MSLKELEVRHAKPAAKPYKMFDGGGLFLLVSPNGSRLWRLKYRRSGKEKLLALGAYPTVTLAEAREKRTNAKKVLDQGGDPIIEKTKKAQPSNSTFEAIALKWHANRAGSLDPAHEQRVLARMKRDIFPELGHKNIEEIRAADVLDMIRKIEARGALDISRRAKQCVGQVFRFAIASGLAENDPTPHLNGALKPRPRVRHMSRLPINRLPELLTKLANYDEEVPRRRLVTKGAVTFALLTWARTAEVRFASRDEFEGLDGTEPLWRVPAERMKMKREHLVPLSIQAAQIVRDMMASHDGNFIFEGTHPSKPISENTMIYALYRMGYIGRQTVHGFRGLASTWANEELTPGRGKTMPVRRYHEDWVEMQLAHADEDSVRGAYNAAQYLVPRRRMLQDWADLVTKLASQTPQPPD